MQRWKLHIIWIITGILSYACFDTNTLPAFNPTDGKIVIEASVLSNTTRQKVIVSRTNEGDSLDFTPLTNALVSLSDNKGHFEELTMHEPGYYYSEDFKGIPGNTYSLQVMVNDTLYEAEERMVPSFEFDSIRMDKYENFSDFDDGNYIFIHAIFDTNYSSYYRITVSKNDSIYNGYEDLLIFDDSFTSGYFDRLIPYAFEVSDTVDLHFYSISEQLHDYYLHSIYLTHHTFNMIGSIVKNPQGNISNEALGYFMVSDVNSLQIIIQGER